MRGWGPLVFGMALAARLAFLFLGDEPLLYRHQYNYFGGALAILEHPQPAQFILRSEEWRTWGEVWTNAPLYYLFVAGVFAVFGPHLTALQVVQSLMDSGVAVLVGLLGRRAASSLTTKGHWAGLAYAFYWPAIEMSQKTMTENLHTPFLVAGFLALLGTAEGAGEAEAGVAPSSVRRGVVAGLLFGWSVLARAVGLLFVPLAVLWLARVQGRRFRRPAAAFVIAVVAVIGPWVARNWWIIGDPSPIESVSIYNLWADNTFVDESRFSRQEYFIGKEKTPAARREVAVWYVKEALRERWDRYPEKVRIQLTHFLRPEGLWVLMGAEQAWPAWRHVLRLFLDDLLLAAAIPLFFAYLVAGRPSPIRSLLLIWTVYYLLMVAVVFHNEIRYRSALVPFAFAGAAGGLALLADPDTRRRRRAQVALLGGIVIVLVAFWPLLPPLGRAVSARLRLRAAESAVARGDWDAADRAVLSASAADAGSARPWTTYGRWLAAAGRFEQALAVYDQAQARIDHHWVPRLVRPRLLAETGRRDEAAAALQAAHDLSSTSDPWLMLEVAWRELPPPRGTVVEVGGNDYGAVRGFLHPKPGHRWSRGHAWLRLVPETPAPAYDVTLVMGSAPPSPDPHPEVLVRVKGGAEARFQLSPEVRAYSLRTPAPGDGVVRVEIRSPIWSRAGHAAEQGVQVHRMTVTPVQG